jgi:hypothetical protein
MKFEVVWDITNLSLEVTDFREQVHLRKGQSMKKAFEARA